ncbi:GGDEF domain-containing protein, partial [Cronobacter dublinensis subsp. dublinensis]|nr:GGDEF domain-containing protein [Cronobacter dublinensis subsp. dublinensis]
LRNNLPGMLSSLMLLIGFLIFSSVVFRKVRGSIRDQQELKQLRDELLKANQTFKSMAMADSLTGLANRRKFDTTLAQVLEASAGSGSPVSLIMLDIDFFKRYNDSRGHAAGDACLRLIGNTLQMVTLRTSDLVARYGGEEFAIVLPDTSAEEALALAQRAVMMVREKHLPHPSTELAEQIVTISAGCHTVKGGGREDAFSALIRGADTALYLAKNRGRNQAFSLPNTIAVEKNNAA